MKESDLKSRFLCLFKSLLFLMQPILLFFSLIISKEKSDEGGNQMEQMIRQAQKGDEEAFIRAVNEMLPQLYKIARVRLKNEADIGDAIQETILAAFTHLENLKEPRYFKTWLIKILMNQCNDIVKNCKVVYVDSYQQILHKHSSEAASDNIGESIEFDSLLQPLNEEYRLVIVLYYVNQLKIKEISEVLNEKEGTIKSRLSRARSQFKEYYLQDQTSRNGGV